MDTGRYDSAIMPLFFNYTKTESISDSLSYEGRLSSDPSHYPIPKRQSLDLTWPRLCILVILTARLSSAMTAFAMHRKHKRVYPKRNNFLTIV
jgi:hypothetical protein